MNPFPCIECQKRISRSAASGGDRTPCPACHAVARATAPPPAVAVAAGRWEPEMRLVDESEDPAGPVRKRRCVPAPAHHTVKPMAHSEERDARLLAMDALAGLDVPAKDLRACETCGTGVVASAPSCTRCGGSLALPGARRAGRNGWRRGVVGRMLGAR